MRVVIEVVRGTATIYPNGSDEDGVVASAPYRVELTPDPVPKDARRAAQDKAALAVGVATKQPKADDGSAQKQAIVRVECLEGEGKLRFYYHGTDFTELPLVSSTSVAARMGDTNKVTFAVYPA